MNYRISTGETCIEKCSRCGKVWGTKSRGFSRHLNKKEMFVHADCGGGEIRYMKVL